ncbi:MAG: SDR family oxidoreductase [Agarilytica sp.]
MKDKVVVITGAGSGLGRELAKVFVSEGAKVIGLGRSSEKLKQTSEELASDNFDFYVADVGHVEQVESTIATILAKYGRIDVLFNNAAVYPKVNFLNESAGGFSEALNTNVNGIAFTCKSVLPAMIKNGYGRIFNVGSWADLAPIADSVVYSASKGAVHALTKGIAVDVVKPDVDVEIHEWIPGHLNTQMSDYTGMEPAMAASWAVGLVNKTHPMHKHQIYMGNQLWQPPKGLKDKIKSKLMFWK